MGNKIDALDTQDVIAVEQKKWFLQRIIVLAEVFICLFLRERICKVALWSNFCCNWNAVKTAEK